jgi:hypothetical protein
MDHLDAATIRAYRQKRLTQATLLAAEEHLASCADCRHAALPQSGNAAEALMQALLAAEEHLDYATLEGLVDDTLAPTARRAAGDHLKSCASCRHDLADLRETAGVIAPAPGRRGNLLSLAAAVLLLVALGFFTRYALQRNAAVATAPNRPRALVHDAVGTISLGANGAVAGLALDAGEAALVRTALSSGHVSISTRLAALQRAHGTLMGAATAGFEVVSPVGMLLRESRPHFQWTALGSGANYHVEVYDDARTLILRSPSLHEVTWTAAQELSRGGEYVWQVVAVRGGERVIAPRPPAGEAYFGILDDAAAARVDHAAASGSHLLRGLSFAREGLLPEARKELQALARMNPGSATVQALARSVAP